MRGEPRYIEALPSRMITTSQKAGMYAPPAALGPNSTQTCGTTPLSLTSVWKMRPAPRRPGNICPWRVISGPAGASGELPPVGGGRRAGRGGEVDQRRAPAERALLDADDLLDGLRAP